MDETDILSHEDSDTGLIIIGNESVLPKKGVETLESPI